MTKSLQSQKKLLCTVRCRRGVTQAYIHLFYSESHIGTGDSCGGPKTCWDELTNKYYYVNTFRVHYTTNKCIVIKGLTFLWKGKFSWLPSHWHAKLRQFLNVNKCIIFLQLVCWWLFYQACCGPDMDWSRAALWPGLKIRVIIKVPPAAGYQGSVQ